MLAKLLRSSGPGTLSLKKRVLLPALLVAILLPGCATLNWYGHMATGQARLLFARQPVSNLLDSETTAPELRAQLEYSQQVLDFAKQRLGLPVANQYSDYVDTRRDRAVWALFAAPEFSLNPQEWCYPLIGCASYRGYFDRARAEKEQARLTEQNLDTWIGGIRAYSTLGWFDDPLLNTFIYSDQVDLAALLFHELAHHVVFVPNDTSFNESFASFVEQEGLRQWLHSRGEAGEYPKYQRREAMRARFHTLVSSTSRELETLYAGGLDPEKMRREKQDLLRRLREAHHKETRKNPDFATYAAWFEGPLNNAKLSTVRTYQQWVPAFARLFEASGEDFSRFYDQVRRLARMDPDARLAHLQDNK